MTKLLRRDIILKKPGILDWMVVGILSMDKWENLCGDTKEVPVEKIRDLYHPYHEMDITQECKN